ncbi:MAG TPA: galactokinase family protein [Blastocatellia bacterium]|nr:galactokinase family protein [Blastocatellia bacterium]
MDEPGFYQRLISAGLSPDQAAVKAVLFSKASALIEANPSAEFHYWFVPGRIEFLGKHTDYAGGRSLICTVERGFCVVAAPRADDVIRITDATRQESVELSISPDLIPRAGHWSNYAATVATRIAQNFPVAMRGADIVFISDLPPAAGLSSSSALIIAVFQVIAWVNNLTKRVEYKSNISSLEDLAGYLGTVENGQTFGSLIGRQGVGTFGGSQDHTAILCCKPGALSQYSFCPVRHENTIALPNDYTFVVGCSGVSADKTGNALDKYNRVSLLAREVLWIWNKATSRKDETLMAAISSQTYTADRIRKAISSASSSSSDAALLNRLEQFIEECVEIIPEVARELAAGRVDRIGVLVDRSQCAAERGLGNQVPETIALARLARELGAAASSAFGAGFGGSVWALVKADQAESFAVEWADRYRNQFPKSAGGSQFFLTRAGPPVIDFEK